MFEEEFSSTQHPHDPAGPPADPFPEFDWAPDDEWSVYDALQKALAYDSQLTLNLLESELRTYAHEYAALIHVEVRDPSNEGAPPHFEPLIDEFGTINEKHLRSWVQGALLAAGRSLSERGPAVTLDRVANSAAFNPPPDDHLTFEDLLEADLQEHDFRVDGMLIHGGNLLLAAEAKAAKTTFMINLVRALLSGDDFLGLGVRQIDVGRRVTYWDCELEQSYSRDQFAQIGIERTDALSLVSMKGHAASLMTATGMDWAVQHLRARSTDVWIIDTFSRVFEGDENDNSAVNAFLLRLDEIKKRAGVREIYLIHHAGHQGKDSKAPRSRGASALNGWPDTILTIEVVNPNTEGDTQRLLRSKGRGVTVPDIAYTWERETNRISPTELQRVRSDRASRKQKAEQTVEAITTCLRFTRDQKKGDIAKATALSETAVKNALQEMVEKGVATFWVGDGRNGTVMNAKYFNLLDPTDES